MGRPRQDQSQTNDPRLTQAYLDNIGTARSVADNLPNQQFAGFTPAFGQGAGFLTGGAGMGQQVLGSGIQAAQMGSQFAPQQVAGGSFMDANIGQYMNPFQSEVIDRTLGDLNRARMMQQEQTGDAAARAGAYGGSRQGVLEAETNRAFFDRAGNVAAGLRSQGFDTAAGLAGQDLSRGFQAQMANQQAGLQGAGLNLQGAGLLGNLGGQLQGMNQADASALMNLGLTQQQLQQQQLDAPMQRMLMQQDLRNQALGIVPGGTGGTGAPRDRFGQLIGAGGAVLGGMATGSSGFFSDRRLKENIVKVGVDENTGLNLYDFSYIGESRRYRGVMADEVEKAGYNSAVIVGENGFKKVKYQELGLAMQEVA